MCRGSLLVGAIASGAIAFGSARGQAYCPGRAAAVEIFGGTAWSAPLPLTLELPAGRTVTRPRFTTRPFADSPYYSYRALYSRADGASVEAEMLHHKLYLENPSPPIERLEITHGYNLPMLNATGPGRGWQLRIGLGLVVAHPEGRVAGREVGGLPTALGGGYHIAGLTSQVAVGRRYPLAKGRVALTAAPEAKVTASWARMRLGELTMTAPNAALHVLGGIGVRRCE